MRRQAAALRPRGKESRKDNGFIEQLKAHERWHIDVAYINIAGTFVFMAKLGEHVLPAADGHSSVSQENRSLQGSTPSV